MEHLFFAAYLILFAWVVIKIPFFKKAGLTSSQLVILFLLKVMAGIFYGWIGVYYGNLAQMVDTWGFHYESIAEYDLLKSDPHEFFFNLFRTPYEHGYEKFFSSENSWWNDLRGNFLIKILALFNAASFGNYYINVIFYSFLSLFGPIAVYRVMKDFFPLKGAVVLITCFLIPSFLYWTSGIHKDGLIFLGFGLVIYHFYFTLKRKKLTLTGALLILLGFVLIVIQRNFLLLTLIPALLAWFIAQKVSAKPILSFSVSYLVFIVLFFSAKLISPTLDFPQAVADKQKSFLQLKGGSAVPVTKLKPNAISFMVNAPQALGLSAIRPYPTDVKHLLSLAAAMEVALLIVIVLLSIFYKKERFNVSPFLLFCIFFSVSVLLTIGYTVNFLGAIVRYRSIVLPFLIVPFAVQVDWKRLFSTIGINIIYKINI